MTTPTPPILVASLALLDSTLLCHPQLANSVTLDRTLPGRLLPAHRALLASFRVSGLLRARLARLAHTSSVLPLAMLALLARAAVPAFTLVHQRLYAMLAQLAHTRREPLVPARLAPLDIIRLLARPHVPRARLARTCSTTSVSTVMLGTHPTTLPRLALLTPLASSLHLARLQRTALQVHIW